MRIAPGPLILLLLLGFFLVAAGALMVMGGQRGAEAGGIGIILIGPLPIIIESPDPLSMLGLLGLVFIAFLAAIYVILRRRPEERAG